MKSLLLLSALLPTLACADDWDWVELGRTPEARIMLDRGSVEVADGKAKAWLRFLYNQKQPGQTITKGKPFDSSINQYYVVCSARKFQVLQLVMFHKDENVGSFHATLNPDSLDQARPQTGVMFLINKVCPAAAPDAAMQ